MLRLSSHRAIEVHRLNAILSLAKCFQRLTVLYRHFDGLAGTPTHQLAPVIYYAQPLTLMWKTPPAKRVSITFAAWPQAPSGNLCERTF